MHRSELINLENLGDAPSTPDLVRATEKTIQLLTTKKGGDNVLGHVKSLFDTLSSVNAPVKSLGMIGVGYPFYFLSAEGTPESVEKIFEYREYNTRKQRQIIKALGPSGSWVCVPCEQIDSNLDKSDCNNCLISNGLTPFEFFRAVVDSDTFLILPDSIDYDDLKRLGGYLEINGFTTWDQDFGNKLKRYISDEGMIFSDVHLLRKEDVIKAYTQALEFVNLAINSDLNSVRRTLINLLHARTNSISWRGKSSWDFNHTLPLVYDILMSGYILNNHINCEQINLYRYNIAQAVRTLEHAEKIIRTVVELMPKSPNTKEYRFIYEEDECVRQSIFYSALLRLGDDKRIYEF